MRVASRVSLSRVPDRTRCPGICVADPLRGTPCGTRFSALRLTLGLPICYEHTPESLAGQEVLSYRVGCADPNFIRLTTRLHRVYALEGYIKRAVASAAEGWRSNEMEG
jgi:hypothetical protein